MSYAVNMEEGENLGSLRLVSLAMKYWLDSVNPVSFKISYDWEAMDFVPETAFVKEVSKDTENGTEYSYQVSFLFNRQNAAMYTTMRKYIEGRGVIDCTDNNGLRRIIGTPESPVTFNYDADTGQGYSSLNYYKISATWVSSEPAVIL